MSDVIPDDLGEAGVPEAARQRLSRGGPFSSALGVGEALVLREAGLQPIAQVMGTSIYKVGWQQMPWGSRSGGFFSSRRESDAVELDNQTDAYNTARGLAVARLREEALAAGADAVVGVHMRRHHRDWATDLVEFVAIGTAVRSTRFALAGNDGEPLLCNLSGQDAVKLIDHGFWPVGIVGGSTVVYIVSSSQQTWRSGRMFAGNQELPDYTTGLYEARQLAMRRVERGAHELHAHGVVGVDFARTERDYEREVNNTTYHDLIVEIHVLGTAIVEVEHDQPPPPKHFTLPLT